MSSYSFCKELVNSIVDAVTLTYETDQLNKAAKKAFGSHIPEIVIPIARRHSALREAETVVDAPVQLTISDALCK